MGAEPSYTRQSLRYVPLSILLWWGPNFTLLYKDACVPFLGESRHPRRLGAAGRDCWEEHWEVVGPALESVRATGQGARSEAFSFFVARTLPREEVVARPLNCNADMYALESRVTRSIDGHAAHFDIPKWRDPPRPQLPHRFSAQPAACVLGPRARSCSATHARDTDSTHPPPDRWQCDLGWRPTSRLAPKDRRVCGGCCPWLP